MYQAWVPEWSKGVDLRPTVVKTRRFEPCPKHFTRLAQSVERQALNLVVVGSIPTVGAFNNLNKPSKFKLR